jgi:hypothetical protein
VHPKIVAVASYVVEKVRNGDKVVLFCHHHATAGELTGVLWRKLTRLPTFPKLPHRMLRGAWTEILNRGIEHHFAADPEKLQDLPQYVRIFVKWLCSPLIQGQTESWLHSLPTSHRGLVDALTKIQARSARGPQISQAAITLFMVLTDPQSKSTRSLLREANDNDDVDFIPGGRKEAPRLLTMCPPPEGEKKHFLYHYKQPDTALAIFNSPFGPDVLIATDALSEGIDLHSYCRTVIHYELNPSPIRTIQRNGRLRRINSWAAKIQKPVECSYPYLKGTRDERLVAIMQHRLAAFSLLLGGAPEIQLDEDTETSEKWRMEVIDSVKSKLQKNSTALRAHAPG